jgi:hypothetical protein
MFAALPSDTNSLKSGLLHLTGQPYCKKSRSARVKDGIINLILGTILLIDTITFKNISSEEESDKINTNILGSKPGRGKFNF